jgi:hypothetical protein
MLGGAITQFADQHFSLCVTDAILHSAFSDPPRLWHRQYPGAWRIHALLTNRTRSCPIRRQTRRPLPPGGPPRRARARPTRAANELGWPRARQSPRSGRSTRAKRSPESESGHRSTWREGRSRCHTRMSPVLAGARKAPLSRRLLPLRPRQRRPGSLAGRTDCLPSVQWTSNRSRSVPSVA